MRMHTVPNYEEAINSLQARRDLVLQMMEKVLQPGVHYGLIPGCGNKPSLFLPGAEQLSSTFNFCPRYKKTITREGQHLICDMICELYLPDGTFVGEGTAMCSTYETKYRYRQGVGEPTGQPVPKKYWDLKKTDFKAAQESIGGAGFTVKKIDNQWAICTVVEKSENPDLADQWNTVVKMGAKRAFVHAVRTATGTADVFTQDLEDFRDSYGQVIDAEVLPPATTTATQAPAAPTPKPAGNDAWEAALAELDAATQGMPRDTRESLLRLWAKEDPAKIGDLRKEIATLKDSLANGWDAKAENLFKANLKVLKGIFEDGGQADRYKGENDHWQARRNAEAAGPVLRDMEARVGKLQGALTTALAKKSAPAGKPAPQDEEHRRPDAMKPPIPKEVDEFVDGMATPLPKPGTPEFKAMASGALNAACSRLFAHYKAKALAKDDAGLAALVKDKRNQVMGSLKIPAEAHYDEKVMALAKAIEKEADHLKIPSTPAA
jgi:hypothetical protein